MNKFGVIKGLDEAIASVKEIEDKDVVPTDDEIHGENPSINNLMVKRLPANDMIEKYKPVAASGNKPAEDDSAEPYPAMEFGIGSGSCGKAFKKGMTQTESSDGAIVDETPFDKAKDDRQENTLDKTTDMFKQMFGDNYANYVSQKPKIDHDFTQAKTILKGPTETFKVKRGW